MIQKLLKKTNEPKYKQIISGIEEAIHNKELKPGDALPSLNKVKTQYQLSRDTVLMAFKDLKSRGIIESVVGKGYYVKSDKVHLKYKVFLLFDELNAFKEDLYNAFISGLDQNVEVDIYFHHFNQEVFKSLIRDKAGQYNYYVIMPANLTNTGSVISLLPEEKVYILDQINDELGDYRAIYQDFKENMSKGLSELMPDILNYSQCVLIYNAQKQPQDIKIGFELFCATHEIPYKVLSDLPPQIPKDSLFMTLDDKDLIDLLKELQILNYELGKDVGIISYNETPLKEIVANGITTISTDFSLMGQRLSEMILNDEHRQLKNPLRVIKRNSL